MERPPASGTEPQALPGTPQGVSKKPLLHTRYTRNRGGNVEQSWCFRGERLRYRSSQVPNASATVSEGADRPERSAGKKTFDNRILILRRFKKRFGSESNPSAKVLHFFDMAMGWFGLRAVLVRIACMCPNDWAKQEKKHKE